jgi:1,2-diacylglycerol 3-alpha-glucosyltransferase
LNIGLFTETYYPAMNGVANSVYLLKTGLEKRGHNVYVFTTTSPKATKFEHNVFRVHSIPFVFLTQLRIGLFYDPKLARKIRELNLDIIHTHTEFSLGIFGRIMAKELNIPLVHTYHTTYEACTHYITHGIRALDTRVKAIARKCSRICCNSVDQVIVPSQKTKELLLKYQVYKDITVIPTGVDLEKFNPDYFFTQDIHELKSRYGIIPQDKVILYVGRVSQEKHLEEIIGFVAGYMKSRKHIRFVMVGDGPALEGLKRQVEKEGLSDRFVFTGAKPWDTIGLYYQLGDVFVSSSRCETQGLTYLEAFAAGLPIVVREDKCLKGILVEEKNGYSYRDCDSFFRGLDRTLFQDVQTDYTKNAIDVAGKYSAQKFAYQVEAVYRQVLSRDSVFCVQTSYDDKKMHGEEPAKGVRFNSTNNL